MDLSTAKYAFERVSEKQKMMSHKTQEVIDRVRQPIEQVLSELQSANSDHISRNERHVLVELLHKLNEMAPVKHIEGSTKELNMGFAKYSKIIEKDFTQDLSAACRNVDWDIRIIDLIVACHFYREGLFNVGDRFVQEAHVPDAANFRSVFMNMHQILEAMRRGNLEPALSWAASQHEQLLMNGSDLELKLHRLQFLDKVEKGKRDEALQYARKYLGPFASTHKHEIERLMGSLLFVGRLDGSPYTGFTELISPAQWDKLADELSEQFCSLLGQPSRNPLSTVVSVGLLALPVILKMARVLSATNQNWQEIQQLPSALNLPNEFQFHSIFVCPVLWELSSEENPPMMLPCGHVLCKHAITKMAKGNTRNLKCPYCPSLSTANDCKQLYF